MKRPSLFRWSTRWAIGAFLCLLAFALALVVINAIDYAPYGLALRRANRLNAQELQALAVACSRFEKEKSPNLSGEVIPSEFRALKPVSVSFSRGSSDISLFSRDDERYVFLRVSTSDVNQVIKLISYCGQHQHERTLWERDLEQARRVDPRGRLLTLSQWKTHSGREWIALPTKLLVIDRYYTSGSSDRIVAEVSLDAEQRDAIEKEIQGLSPEVRGHVFDGGALDGIQLVISFSTDGKENLSTDIRMANAWCRDAENLVRLISKLAGKECEIDFPDVVKEMNTLQGRPPLTMPLAEYDRLRNGLRLPWWCWWPRWMDNEG